MEIISVSSDEQLALKASDWIKTEIQSEETKRIFLPAGNTPKPLYNYWTSTPPGFLGDIKFQPVDDIISGEKAGFFSDFFKTNLPNFSDRILPISDDLPLAELAVLGLGENGHVAFHEPGIPSNFYGGCIQLSEKTCTNLKLEPGTWGITYGLSSFLSSRSILLIVSGERKRSIFKRFLEEENTFPATYLKNHARLSILADQAAIGDSLEF